MPRRPHRRLLGRFAALLLLGASLGCRRRPAPVPSPAVPAAPARPAPVVPSSASPSPPPVAPSGPPQVAATEALSWAASRAAATQAASPTAGELPPGVVADLDGDSAAEELVAVDDLGCAIVRARAWGTAVEVLDATGAHTGHHCERVATPALPAMLLVQGDGHETNTDETPVTSNTWRAMTLWRLRPDRRAVAVFDDREEEDGPRSGHTWRLRPLDARHLVQSRSASRAGVAVTDHRVLREGANGFEPATCYLLAPPTTPPVPARCTVTLRNDIHLRDSEVAASEGTSVARGTVVQVLHAASLRRGDTRMYCLQHGAERGLAFLTDDELAGCPEVF